MSDIVVTVPKDQVEHFEKDKMTAIEAWWYLPNRPKHLEPEDYIGFVYNGAIRAGAIVWRIEEDEDRWMIVFRDCGFVDPVPHSSFRGFKYMDLTEIIWSDWLRP